MAHNNFHDQHEQWHPNAFNQANSWPHTNNVNNDPGFRNYAAFQPPYEQQPATITIPNVPLFPSNSHAPPQESSSSVLPSSSVMGFQADHLPSKAPNFANILQYQAPAVPSIPDAGDAPSAQKRRTRARAQHRVNPRDWDKYKTHVKKLYLEEGKTVQEIMEEMKSSFNFQASEQMYKNKLSEWGFSKYMPKGIPEGVIEWVALKMDERKREGKETEFVYDKRLLPIDRIQQTAKRAKHHNAFSLDKATPSGLEYNTPSSSNNIPSPFHKGIVTPIGYSTAHSRWKPGNDSSQSKSGPLRVHWKGLSLSELETARRDAKTLCESGRLDEAEQKLRDSLDGFVCLLLPTNERTLSVAYELAEFYASNNQMNNADAVLQWMAEQLVETFGLDHRRTISHMIHVVDLYQQWSRSNDALTILLRALESFHDPPNTAQDLTARSNRSEEANQPSKDFESGENLRISNFSRVVDISEASGQKDANGSLEFQLGIIHARVRACDPESESLILGLIDQAEKFPDHLEPLLMKSHASLIDLYLQLGKDEELEPALETVKKKFLAIMKQKNSKTLPLLDAAVELASIFVKASCFEDANVMFSQVERHLTDANDDDCDNAIDILIDIGMLYQSHNRWNDARARFEHALSLTMCSRGPESKMARRLQAALDNRNFSFSSLPVLEHRSSLRKRLMEF